jgi:hypothetical protein
VIGLEAIPQTGRLLEFRIAIWALVGLQDTSDALELTLPLRITLVYGHTLWYVGFRSTSEFGSVIPILIKLLLECISLFDLRESQLVDV